MIFDIEVERDAWPTFGGPYFAGMTDKDC